MKQVLDDVNARLEEIRKRLNSFFDKPRIPHGDPLSVLIRGILSQNTSDANRDRAYRELKKRFKSYDEILKAPLEELENAIRSGGLARQKALRIKKVLKWVKDKYGRFDLSPICNENPEKAQELLMSINGIGIKTARVTLLFGCGMRVFPVDTHIARIMRRTGIVPPNWDREKIHRFLDGRIREGEEAAFHLNLIRLGREICLARRPRCSECPIRDLCNFAEENRELFK